MLLLLPQLVRQQEDRSGMFVENSAAWLAELERIFTDNKLYQSASIAMLRSSIVAARQGQIPSGIAFKGLPSRSRIRSAVAAQAIQKAAEVASSIIAENQRRFAEAEAIAQQLVAVAIPRGLVLPRSPGMSNTEYLADLRMRLMKGDLENAVLHLEGLVGPNDTLILLDRALALRRAILAEVPTPGTSSSQQPYAGATPSQSPTEEPSSTSGIPASTG